MNADGFVEECRREWKRLRVAAEVAEEMAAELRADLAEAAADGVPAEELLGAGAFDARGFAAAWASERGVVPARPRGRTRLLAGAAVVLAAVGVAAGLLSTRSTTPKHGPPSVAAPSRTVVVMNPVTGAAVRKLVYQLSAVQQSVLRPTAVPRP